MVNLLYTIKWILITILLLAWLLISLENAQEPLSVVVFPTILSLPSTKFGISVGGLLGLSIVISYIVFGIVGVLDSAALRLDRFKLRKEIDDLKREVHHLRNLPIKEGEISDQNLSQIAK